LDRDGKCSMTSFLLDEIADKIEGKVIGDGGVEITGVAGIKSAGAGELTFLANPKYETFLEVTEASAIVASFDCRSKFNGSVIVTDNPYLAFLRAVQLFDKPHLEKYERIVEGSARVHETAELGEDIHVGMCVNIGKNTVIGARSTVLPFTYIGEDVTIEEDSLIYPHVTIREGTRIGKRVIIQAGAVIGSDGFGYAKDGCVNQKIPQIGIVVIEDDVEIGANSTIDRATTGQTLIKRGSKIDNLVQIAHNVVIGENSVVAAQAGVSGSTELGRNVVLAGQSGLVGHIKIGDNAKVGAQGGVTKSVPADTSVSGYPAREHSSARRVYAATARLPGIIKEFRKLQKAVEQLKKGVDSGSSTEDH